MIKTALDLTVAILDVNETIEVLKNRNMGNQPDKDLCKTVELLEDYRNVIISKMEHTDIEF